MTRSNQSESQLYIGLMSGTSIDGVDVALVDFSANQHKLVESYLHPVENSVRNKLGKLCDLVSQRDMEFEFHHRIELLGEMDVIMGQVFADSVNTFLHDFNIDKSSIIAIGSHGQTIRHQPDLQSPFTIQIGDSNMIAHRTGITTVSDFRRMDMAAGGQGAPLAPAFHEASMRTEEENRIILNLGGIANITFLPKDKSLDVLGFDTGTANTLLDAHYKMHHKTSNDFFDRDANFAKRGEVDNQLLEELLKDPYFALLPPKSTGREYFSFSWLNKILDLIPRPISKEDLQATLLEFSAKTIADAILKLNLESFAVYASGGGMHNDFLLKRIERYLSHPIGRTNDIGVDGDYLEAMTFAWLAHQRINNLPGNLPSVTGAKERKVLGGIYHP